MLKSMLPWRDSFAQVSCTSRSRGSRKADRPPTSSVCSGSHWGERPPGDAGGGGRLKSLSSKDRPKTICFHFEPCEYIS